MKRLLSIVRRILPRAGQRGSALLVTLMVMVGLSLLGLGFVAISETESAIASNERSGAQTLIVTEAGAKAVVEWFQDPVWALAQNLMPANDPICGTSPCIKMERKLDTSTSATAGAVYDGFYKAVTGELLFDKSFRNNDGKFFGTEDNPDILINDKTAPTFLAGFNIQLFNTTVPVTLPTGITAATACNGCDNTQGGRVTEIRVYAPPTDGGIVNSAAGWTTTAGVPAATGFRNAGTRFGVATIRVTGVKYNSPQCGPYRSGCVPLATRTVKFVIAEWPVPGPGGPVQSAANLTNAGNVNIHWGRSTSEGDLNLTKTQTAIPWHDAYNIANIERGYDVMWPVLPLDPDYKKKYNWRNELIGRTFTDPWWGTRARGTNSTGSMSGTAPHPLTWDGTDVTVDPSTGNAAQSSNFQSQTKSDGVNYQEVLFPRIDYNFWKQVAVAGTGQTNVKYLRWSASDSFMDNTGCTQTFLQWIDTTSTSTCNGGNAPAGFYFFDTTDGTNPQGIVNPTNLTPGVQISGASFLMKGFIYLNASDYKTTGASGPTLYYNMPGETFRDVGYRAVETDSTLAWYKAGKRADPLVPCTWDATGAGCVTVGVGNGVWDYQDLPWSNLAAGTVGDGVFNVHVTINSAAIPRSSPTTPIAASTQYFVDPYVPGCIPGDNSCVTCTCSEPHEPYINYIYPTTAGSSVVMKWENPVAQTRRPKTFQADGVTPVVCSSGSSPKDCTSNGYDMDGALVTLDASLDGVFYTEGTDSSTGNAVYFGSLLIRNTFDNKGTPDVWFDEKLVKGEWPPKSFNFPRVYVSSEETDQ